jgi:very-short-patch-repair endonuclease
MERFPTILIPPHLSQIPQAQVFSVVQPMGEHQRPPKGHSETQFERDLWSYFPGKIHVGLLMPRSDGHQPYVPDFAYIDPTLDLYIDIEIDEPYTHVTRQAVHYLDAEKDAARNQYFLNGGWIVIRFSEKQVIESPASCCKTIASTIASLTGNNTLMAPFREVPTLKPAKRWTADEAKAMAAIAYREQYLTVSVPAPQAKRKRRKPIQTSQEQRLITASLRFHCPECGEIVRWQGHYICCSTCGYDAFVM